ncbi:MAG: ankyrin repeat domain-containing protein, partial [Planctomycetota bacterium]
MRRLVISISILLLLVSFSPVPTFASANVGKTTEALQQAARDGDIEHVRLLIARGADVNAKDNSGWTPLHQAAGGGHKDIVELLIEKGADVNAKDNKLGMTPLHWAAGTGRSEVAELLIARGAEVNAQDKDGQTAAWWAKNKGHTQVAELLSKPDADEPITGQRSNIYEQSLAAFIKEIDSTYPFFDLKGIRGDWGTCKKELLEKSKQCKSNEEFYGLLNEARLCLRDAHMGFANLKGQLPQAEVLYYPGVSFLPAANGQIVVMSCMSEYSNKLKPGTIVTEINGQNARNYLDSDAKKSWKAGGYFSSPQRAKLFSYRIPLKGKQNDNHQITIINNGKTESIRIVNKFKASGWPHYYAMPTGLKQRGNCSYVKLKSGYGYIYLRRIRGELVAVIDEALNSFEDIRGLIIDLRGNGGGGYGREVFTRFDKKQGPSAEALFYQGDMVVLIDAGAISAGETFARDLVYSAGAYLMGSRTAGSSTAKRQWQIPNGLGTVTLSTRSRWGFERQPIEYNGIAPNKTVEVVPAELQNGINSGIRRAEEYLDKKWAQKSAADRNLPLIVRKKEYPGQFERTQPIRTTYTTSTAEPDPIADPNAVKASIKAFEGLEKALTQVDRRSRYEVREWLQTRLDNRIKLVK